MPREGNITLTIHGLVEFNDEVDGEVFAEKFSAFMKGLAVSDQAANGERRHKFIIAALVKNTATASVAEYQIRGGHGTRSGADYYAAGIDEIRRDSSAARLLPLEFVRSIATLNKGVESRFAFGELKFADDNVVRIDTFLAQRAERVLSDIKRQDREKLSFEGTAYGAFDGVLKAVDLQPEMKRAVLWLSAGDLPIQCNITDLGIDEVRAALDQRATAYGLAHYDGISKLPKLLDIRRIEPIAGEANLSGWRGKFEFPPDWPDDTWDEI